MQQFVVPQFIDVEDKIIGPVTTRQFIILLVGFLIIGISYKLFDFSLFVTFGLFMFGVSGIVAFLRINGRPFHYFVLNVFQTLKRPKLRIWHHIYNSLDYSDTEKINFSPAARPPQEKRYTTSRLAELSLVVDTKGSYQGEAGGGGNVNMEREIALGN